MKKARPVSTLREEAIYRPIFAKRLAEIDRIREAMKLDDIVIAENHAKIGAMIEEMKATRADDERKV